MRGNSRNYRNDYSDDSSSQRNTRKRVTSPEAQQLEAKMKTALDNIPHEFKSEKFSHVAYVARALTSKNPGKYLKELDQYHSKLDNSITEIVDVNYKGFNKSIKHFSDILQHLRHSKEQITTLKLDVTRCRDLLTSRSEDLSQLYFTDLQHSQLINILNQVEEVKLVPEYLRQSIEQKEYLFAVQLIDRYLKLLGRRELASIRALQDIRLELETKAETLHETLLEDLQTQIFKSTHRLLLTDPVEHPNPQQQQKQTQQQQQQYQQQHQQRSTPSATALRMQQQYNQAKQNVGNMQRHEFISMIIDSLDKLNKLSDVQTTLIQRLRTELHSIIEAHVSTFAHSFDVSSILKLTTSSDTVQPAERAVVQGRQLLLMLKGLFDKFIGLLQNLRFIVEVIAKKLAARSNNDASPFTSPLKKAPARVIKYSEELLLSKEVIDKIRDAMYIKLDDLRADPTADAVFLSSLEDFVESFFDREAADTITSLQSFVGTLMKAEEHHSVSFTQIGRDNRPRSSGLFASTSETSSVFDQLLVSQSMSQFSIGPNGPTIKTLIEAFQSLTQTKMSSLFGSMNPSSRAHNLLGVMNEEQQRDAKRLKNIVSDFKDILAQAFSPNASAATLSIQHVWKTVQDELRGVLQQILGITTADLEKMARMAAEALQTDIDSDSIPGGAEITTSSTFTATSVSFADRKSVAITGSASSSTTVSGGAAGAGASVGTGAPEKMLRFRFSTNVELTEEVLTNENTNFTALSSLTSHFVFTPYNMVWMYRAVREFLELAIPIATPTKSHAGSDAATSPSAFSPIHDGNPLAFLGSTPDNSSVPKGELRGKLWDFINTVIQRSFLPQVKNDYIGKLNDVLEELDSFRPNEVNRSVMGEYTETARPIVHSAIKVSEYMKDISRFAFAIPLYKKELFSVVESLLKRYLDECYSRLQKQLELKYAGECLLKRNDVVALLESDPAWLELKSQTNAPITAQFFDKRKSSLSSPILSPGSTSSPKLSSLSLTSSPIANSGGGAGIFTAPASPVALFGTEPTSPAVRFQQEIELTIDGPLSANNSISKQLIIYDTSPVILLANMCDSLEWLANQITAIGHVNANATSTSSGVSSLPMASPAKTSSSVKSLVVFESRRLEDLYNRLRQITDLCLFALKIDIRARCYYFLEGCKTSNYWCEEESVEPESFIKTFNQDISRVERCLSSYLPFPKMRYIFTGVSRLISNIMINSVTKMDQRERRFNLLGLAKLRRNVLALQQNMTNVVVAKDAHFNHVRQYYELLDLTDKELLADIAENGFQFTFEQYKAILTAHTHKHPPMEPSAAQSALDALYIQYQQILQLQAQ